MTALSICISLVSKQCYLIPFQLMRIIVNVYTDVEDFIGENNGLYAPKSTSTSSLPTIAKMEPCGERVETTSASTSVNNLTLWYCLCVCRVQLEEACAVAPQGTGTCLSSIIIESVGFGGYNRFQWLAPDDTVVHSRCDSRPWTEPPSGHKKHRIVQILLYFNWAW